MARRAKKTYYWAYGSNLNVPQMRRRCPGAERLAPMTVPDARLVFRLYADVEYAPGEKCPGALWRITAEDEKNLDRYEGVESGLYAKRYLRVRLGHEIVDCLYYQMTRDEGVMPPMESYLDVIAEGYRHFGLDESYLDRALAAAWDEKEKTPFLRDRYTSKGRLPLAREILA